MRQGERSSVQSPLSGIRGEVTGIRRLPGPPALGSSSDGGMSADLSLSCCCLYIKGGVFPTINTYLLEVK